MHILVGYGAGSSFTIRINHVIYNGHYKIVTTTKENTTNETHFFDGNWHLRKKRQLGLMMEVPPHSGHHDGMCSFVTKLNK